MVKGRVLCFGWRLHVPLVIVVKDEYTYILLFSFVKVRPSSKPWPLLYAPYLNGYQRFLIADKPTSALHGIYSGIAAGGSVREDKDYNIVYSSNTARGIISDDM
jgi:hypothetical protein